MFELMLSKAIEAISPYLFVVMVLAFSVKAIDLIKYAIGIKR